jgi:hypothetical protein
MLGPPPRELLKLWRVPHRLAMVAIRPRRLEVRESRPPAAAPGAADPDPTRRVALQDTLAHNRHASGNEMRRVLGAWSFLALGLAGMLVGARRLQALAADPSTSACGLGCAARAPEPLSNRLNPSAAAAVACCCAAQATGVFSLLPLVYATITG